MKKFVILLSIVAILFSFVACEDETVHIHSWGEGTITKSATCEDSGTNTYTCETCGETKTEAIAKLGHDYDSDNKCTRCNNTKTDIEAAEARIGLKYYNIFEEAVFAAVCNTDEKTVEVLKSNIDLENAHFPVNGSVVINANGADFKNSHNEHDLSIYTYEQYTLNSKTETNLGYASGNIEIVINDAKNLKIWGAGNLIPTNTTVNITLNNCEFDDSSNDFVNIKHTTAVNTFGKLNMTVNNCKVKSANDVGITLDFASKVEISNTTFTNTVLGVNISNDQTDGCEVTIKGCTFTGCGKTEGYEDDQNHTKGYHAPVRLKNSVDSTMTATIEKNTFSDTVSTELGDVMLVDSRSGKTVYPITASFKNNSALSVKVYDGSLYKLEELESGSTKTIKQTKTGYEYVSEES